MQLELPAILKSIRLSKGFSIENIAEEIKVDPTTYGRYEKGESQIKFEQVAQIANFYKMTLDELYNHGNPDFKVSEPKEIYLKKWKLPVTVTLDGTEETLKMWFKKLTAINAAI